MSFNVPIPKEADREVQTAIKLMLDYINQLEARIKKLEKQNNGVS